MSRQDNIKTQQRLSEGINNGNPDIAFEVFAPHSVDHDPAPGQGPGAEGFKQFFEYLGSAFPDAKVTLEHLVADDDNVAIAYTLTGTHQGEFHGVAPTGRRIKARGVQIGRFEAGKIVERWGSTDELGILQQIGTPPAPA